MVDRLAEKAHQTPLEAAAAAKVVSRGWWKLGGAGTKWAWWSGSGGEVKVEG